MHRMRCRQGKKGCGRRFTIRKPPHQYIRRVRCPHCRSTEVRDVNAAALNQTKLRQQAGKICRCRNYPFPHVKGTLRLCQQHPDILNDPTADQWKDYQTVLETPRGSFV